MKSYSKEEVIKNIEAAFPPGTVTPCHNEKGHFYKIVDKEYPEGIVYPSVTGKLQVLKDQSLINYKMNRSLEYVFKHWPEFKEENIMEHLGKAERVATEILVDAGYIGTDIHDIREDYFNHWIKTGVRPKSALDFIPEVKEDIRIKSALRALEKFVDDYDYEPIAVEMFVYSHKLKVAGTLDDLGTIGEVIRVGDKNCPHKHTIKNASDGKKTCLACGYQTRRILCLLDVKTSNQFKDHYFYQVALYYSMFRKLVGLVPKFNFILKLSKEDGTYKIERLEKMASLVAYARALVKVNEGNDFIKGLRKDNQKIVVKI